MGGESTAEAERRTIEAELPSAIARLVNSLAHGGRRLHRPHGGDPAHGVPRHGPRARERLVLGWQGSGLLRQLAGLDGWVESR
ncbi:hypothetical protein GCM10011578_001130 [Streptomyces fuscichromogenes]|uniref:Uncharacterized protein n=1 Tax=Streptomyces fuscichromogenes TaxID=1324013 RepID=A0A917X7H9_9ACTN|nr:hypothetical protein GCM10011578_001130 [Streptomyces fuscichromogenes]